MPETDAGPIRESDLDGGTNQAAALQAARANESYNRRSLAIDLFCVLGSAAGIFACAFARRRRW